MVMANQKNEYQHSNIKEMMKWEAVLARLPPMAKESMLVALNYVLNVSYMQFKGLLSHQIVSFTRLLHEKVIL